MSQDASADRDAYQAGRDNNVTINQTVHHSTDDEYEEPTDSTGSSWGALIFIVFVVISVGGWLFGSGHSEPPFPKKSQIWPSGANQAAIMAPIITQLQSCAKEVVLAPANCPQSTSDTDSGATNVRWSLYGSSDAGARIVYHDGRFDVIGHTVMTVAYQSSYGGPAFSVQLVQYRASVTWHHSTASLVNLQPSSIKPKPAISVVNPNIPWSQLRSAVSMTFQICIRHGSPMPPYCPVTDSTSATDAKWALSGDPLLNARATYDPSWGLIHVIGSYAAVLHYQDVFGPETEPHSGTYDAILAVDNNGIHTLQIQNDNN